MNNFSLTHASTLAAIDHTLAQTYTLSSATLASYYQTAKALVEAKKTEIIDTRNVVELVEQYDGLSSESPESIAAVKAAEALLAKVQAEAAANWQAVTPLPVITNMAVASQKAVEEASFEAWVESQTIIASSNAAQSDGVILDVVTAREKVGLFASALAESLQLAFPGEAIGQSIQAFMLNRSSGIQEIAEVRNRLQQKYPDEGYLINQLTVDDLLVSYPETKAILVDLGLIALELAGGAIARIGGKVIAPLKIPQVSKAVWYKAKGFSDELLRQAKLIVQQTRDAAAQALQNAKTGLDNLIEAGVNTVDDVTRLGDDLMRSLGIEPVPVQGSLNDIRRDHPVSYIDDVTSSLKNWFTKQADNSKDLFNSLINKFDDLKAKVGGSNSGGAGSGVSDSFSVDKIRYASELKHYLEETPFDAQKMIEDGLITKTRYSVSELDILLNDFIEKSVGKSVDGKQGEIIFVMKQNGEMVFSMRRADDYLPHPVLSYGEDVLSAGTITKLDDGTLEITRKSGHFKPELDSLTQVRENLELNGYDVEINPSFQ